MRVPTTPQLGKSNENVTHSPSPPRALSTGGDKQFRATHVRTNAARIESDSPQ
jgi:hypothetical protein